jgi:hypothetical protein
VGYREKEAAREKLEIRDYCLGKVIGNRAENFPEYEGDVEIVSSVC